MFFEPVCLEAMAPFCISEQYEAALTINFGYATRLPGERTAESAAIELLGVTITRAFPHHGVPDNGPRPELRRVCRDGDCVSIRAFCWADRLTCVWARDYGTARGSGALIIEAQSRDAMSAAMSEVWIIVNGVHISLADPDMTPLIMGR